MKQIIGSLYNFVKERGPDDLLLWPVYCNNIGQVADDDDAIHGIFERITMHVSPYLFAQQNVLISRLMQDGFQILSKMNWGRFMHAMYLNYGSTTAIWIWFITSATFPTMTLTLTEQQDLWMDLYVCTSLMVMELKYELVFKKRIDFLSYCCENYIKEIVECSIQFTGLQVDKEQLL